MPRKLTILTVPDEKQRQSLHRKLTQMGFFVISTGEARQGLSLIMNNVPRAFILEPGSDDMPGEEIGRRARELLGERVPIIYFAPGFTVDDFEAYLTVGVDDFLVKAGPLNPLTSRIQFWTSGSHRRLPGRMRHQMLLDLEGARAVSRLAKEGLLSSDTDTTVAEIADFVHFARAEASDQFGRTVMEKLGLLGYAVGAVEYCSRTNIKVKICFHDFLRVVLLETHTLSAKETGQMAGSWDELINAGPFRGASEQAGLDFAAWRQCPGDFEPHYLAALERRYRRSA